MSNDYMVRNTLCVGQLSTATSNTVFHAYELKPHPPFREISKGKEVSRNFICVSPLKLWYTWKILYNQGLSFEAICNLCLSQRELLHSEFGGKLPYEEARFFFSSERFEENEPVSVILHIGYVRRTRQLTFVLPNSPIKLIQPGAKVILLSDRVKK